MARKVVHIDNHILQYKVSYVMHICCYWIHIFRKIYESIYKIHQHTSKKGCMCTQVHSSCVTMNIIVNIVHTLVCQRAKITFSCCAWCGRTHHTKFRKRGIEYMLVKIVKTNGWFTNSSALAVLQFFKMSLAGSCCN